LISPVDASLIRNGETQLNLPWQLCSFLDIYVDAITSAIKNILKWYLISISQVQYSFFKQAFDMLGNEDFEYKFPKPPDNHHTFSLSLYCLKNVSNIFLRKECWNNILDKLKIPTGLFYAFFPEDVSYNVSYNVSSLSTQM
jgi:hypothetical protein